VTRTDLTNFCFFDTEAGNYLRSGRKNEFVTNAVVEQQQQGFFCTQKKGLQRSMNVMNPGGRRFIPLVLELKN